MNEEELLKAMFVGGDSVEENVTVVEEPEVESSDLEVNKQQEVTVQEEAPNLEETFDKSNKAFAEQRIRLKDRDNLMLRFARSAGIEVSNAEDAYAKLSGIVTQQEAKSKNLDPLVLRTLQEQEAKIASYEQEELKKEANASFVDLQKQFGLSNTEVQDFAKQLSREGKNPFVQKGVNLAQEYLMLNYKSLMDKAREQGVAEESERQRRVAQSTAVNKQVGDPIKGKAEAPVSPVDGFNNFINALGIKR